MSHVQADMSINLAKDFTQDTIELIVQGSAGGFVGVSGMDYEWYRRGVSSFFRKEDVRFLGQKVKTNQVSL